MARTYDWPNDPHAACRSEDITTTVADAVSSLLLYSSSE
jgi:hypothetical protein